MSSWLWKQKLFWFCCHLLKTIRSWLTCIIFVFIIMLLTYSNSQFYAHITALYILLMSFSLSRSLSLSLSPLFSPFEFIALEIENWESMQCWWWWLKSTTPLLRACYDNEDNPDRFGLQPVYTQHNNIS
jgi:hypothetical protein